MRKTITSVINDTLSQIRKYGLKEASIMDYQNSLFKPIQKYFILKGQDYYSKELLEEFLTLYHIRMKNGEIGHSYFSRFQKAVHLLISTAETGQTNFSIRSRPGIYVPTSEHMTLIDSILDSAGYRGTTRKDLIPIMKHFFCYIETCKLKINQITDEDVLSFFNEVSATNKASMGRVQRVLKLITAYFSENNIGNLRLNYSMMSVKKTRNRCIAPYSLEEVEAILSMIDKSTEIGVRDYAIILLALGTGLRGCDIVKLQMANIDWNAGIVSVIQKKTGTFLQLPLGGEAINAIADYILRFRPKTEKPYIFLTTDNPPQPMNRCTLYKRLKKYKHLAGINNRERQGFHSLRRTFATSLSSSGVPISIISSLLGHKSIDEDKPYLSYNTEQMSFVAMGCGHVPFSGKYYSECNCSEVCIKEAGRDDLL